MYNDASLDNEDIGILSRRQAYLNFKNMLENSDVPEREWEEYIKSYEEYWNIRLSLCKDYLTNDITFSKIAVLEGKLKQIGGGE